MDLVFYFIIIIRLYDHNGCTVHGRVIMPSSSRCWRQVQHYEKNIKGSLILEEDGDDENDWMYQNEHI